MKRIIFLILFLIPTLAFADRVCLEKSTGKLIEYQSGDAPLGTLTQNAINAGYKASDVIEKYVTPAEWQQIKQTQIDKPAQDLAKQKELERQMKEQLIKEKLKLNDEDFKNLKEALK